MEGTVLRIPRFTRASVLALVALAAACASSGGARTSGSLDRLSLEEIRGSGATNAYELVTRLRPQWLRVGPTGSISGREIRNQAVLVYLDGVRLGDVNSLRSVNATTITGMRYLDAIRAPTVLSDIRNEPIAGAILISTVP